MKNELEPINNDLTTEKITISSLEKLDNNYIRIIGRGYFNRDIDVITNGTLTQVQETLSPFPQERASL